MQLLPLRTWAQSAARPRLFLGDILVLEAGATVRGSDTFLPSTSPLPVRKWAVTLPDGSEVVRPSTDTGRVLITGNPEDFNGFETASSEEYRRPSFLP